MDKHSKDIKLQEIKPHAQKLLSIQHSTMNTIVCFWVGSIYDQLMRKKTFNLIMHNILI